MSATSLVHKLCLGMHDTKLCLAKPLTADLFIYVKAIISTMKSMKDLKIVS